MEKGDFGNNSSKSIKGAENEEKIRPVNQSNQSTTQ